MASIRDGLMDKVSIIIRCKNEDKFIGQTLEKIFKQRVDAPYEVIVIDSGSIDKTIDIAKSYNVRLFQIKPEDFTFGYALNFGVDRAEGNIICNLSAHCSPLNDSWLQELIEPIKKGYSHATFGRQVAVKGVNNWEEIFLDKHFPDHGEITGRIPFSNANCAFLKKLWHQFKFDEELPSWEDYLWYLLLKDKYTFQYCPKALVYHSHPFSIKEVLRRAYIDGKAFKMIDKKYNIDLLQGVCPTVKTKIQIFWNDMKNHVRLFREQGLIREIYLIPFVRLLAYKAYWNGYKSIK